MKVSKLAVLLYVGLFLNAGIELAYSDQIGKQVLMVPADGDEWTEKIGGVGWNWWGTGGWGAHFSIDTADKKVGNGSLEIGGSNAVSKVTLSIGEGYSDKLGNKDYISTMGTKDMDLCFWLKVEWLNPEHPAPKGKNEFIVVCSDGYDVDLLNEARPGVKGKYTWQTDGGNLPWTQVRIKLKDFLLNQFKTDKPYQFEKLSVINLIGPDWSTVHIDGFHWEEIEGTISK
ncbi:MAG: hypothetical protein HY606_09485 [Planctomycetes bacterium]|nr:hypothetical protein [Planctomycetota bacterium]